MKDTSDQQSYQNLSDDYKEIAKQITRLRVDGKKGRAVHIFLKPEFEKAIKLLIDHRQDAKIPPKNEQLFALPSSVGNFRVAKGCNIMNQLASECEASNPSLLNGTLLRKQLATFCSSLELTDNQVKEVADFMGHSKEVHLNVYRQNLIERQLNISQILEAAQGNATNSIADSGKRKENKVTGGGVRKRKKLASLDNGSKSKFSRK